MSSVHRARTILKLDKAENLFVSSVHRARTTMWRGKTLSAIAKIVTKASTIQLLDRLQAQVVCFAQLGPLFRLRLLFVDRVLGPRTKQKTMLPR